LLRFFGELLLGQGQVLLGSVRPLVSVVGSLCCRLAPLLGLLQQGSLPLSLLFECLYLSGKCLLPVKDSLGRQLLLDESEGFYLGWGYWRG